MAEFPTIKEFGARVAENALDGYTYKGKTLREWADAIAERGEDPSGYECFHCGQKSVYWSGDFDYEDYCLDGEGIVHECHCQNCGAQIIYMVPTPEEEDPYQTGMDEAWRQVKHISGKDAE